MEVDVADRSRGSNAGRICTLAGGTDTRPRADRCEVRGMGKRLSRRRRVARFRNGTVSQPWGRSAAMASLTIKNIPEALLDTLRKQAKENNRSLNQEVITCLLHGVGRPKRDPEAIIRRLK